MKILAIDPGTYKSAHLVFDTETMQIDRRFAMSSKEPNESLLSLIKNYRRTLEIDLIACETYQHMGQDVGITVFRTLFWIGRFMQASIPITFELVFRMDIKLYLCGTARADDAAVRRALIERFGDKGTKKDPGQTYGIGSHLWSALAVATYAADAIKLKAVGATVRKNAPKQGYYTKNNKSKKKKRASMRSADEWAATCFYF